MVNVAPEIRTAAGTVRGNWEHAVAVFRGIPYAQPPFGRFRLQAPAPARPWDGIRNALTFGPPVPQSSAAESSDCLTLNVWSPDLGATGLPVLVSIHGGAYLHGTSANPHLDGATLARTGAVVVSMNYRMGVEGFAHVTGAPDNRGILDQLAALRWVQENVTAFGGNPGNVTVFGQSAGAGCIAALLAMPTATGLFRRAITQSIPGTYFAPALARAVSTAIGAEIGAQPTLEEFAGIHPQKLVAATEAIVRKMPGYIDTWGPVATVPTPFSPVVDGDLLPQAPWPALAGGAARDIDLLIGHTRDEYRLLARRFGDITEEQATESLDRLAAGLGGAEAYRAAYPDATPAQLFETGNADWLMRMPTLHLAEAHRGNCWTYELCWSFNADGASHSLDVLLLMGTLDLGNVREFAGPTGADEAVRLGEQMRLDWLGFATGKPTWPRYDPAGRATRIYTGRPTTGPYPEESSRRIWQHHKFDVIDLQ